MASSSGPLLASMNDHRSDSKQHTFGNKQNNQHIREPLLAPLSNGFSSDFSQIIVNGSENPSRPKHSSKNGDVKDSSKATTSVLFGNESKNGSSKSTFSMINNHTGGWGTQYRRDECLLTDEIELDDGGSDSDELDLLPTLSPSASSSGVKFGLNSAGKTTRRVRRFLLNLVPCCGGHGSTSGLGNGGGWLPVGSALQRCSIM
ncbi:hypothetical protein DdX_21438 [Ditylenchus destructor]|uniref:Uncharacterized protein n=1 Tax=Ditylenchus destructor TaxID=166010 RepID=A0AAD4MEW6_9BILA|nr:hypothetical protein DdX_21438 [Ditylenchus destructor]